MTNSTTALSIFFEELKVRGDERELIAKLLTATPLALRGEETMVPKQDLMAATDNRVPGGRMQKRANIRLTEAINNLVSASKVIVGASDNSWASFTVLASVAWVDDSAFLRYRFNAGFLSTLRSIAQSKGINLL